MRDKGYDRSATMCTDKWRNLLKEFKKAKHRGRGSGSSKMSCYKELDELLKERSRNGNYKSPANSKVDSCLQFSDEATSRSELNLERCLDDGAHTLAITASDPVAANGVPPWNWRDNPANGNTPADGRDNQASYGGRVILVKWGEYARRMGIDGTADAIKEAIKSAFGLRTRRAFWLEDEDDEAVRSLDRDLPLETYTLHLDEGLTVKVCVYDDTDRIPVRIEDKTLYTEEDFRDFLSRRCWAGLRELSGFRTVDIFDDLCSVHISRCKIIRRLTGPALQISTSFCTR